MPTILTLKSRKRTSTIEPQPSESLAPRRGRRPTGPSGPGGPVLGYSEARRTALAAQLIHQRRRPGPPGTRKVRSVLDRLGVIQVDSVNILARAHYVPLFSRLGPYDPALLDRMSQQVSHRKRPPWTEYWAHEASLIPVQLRPALVAVQRRTWMTATDLDAQIRDELSHQILALLSTSRPLTARQVESHLGHHGGHQGHWGWNWSVVKRVLEDLFASGQIASAGRNPQFERLFVPASAVDPAAEVPDHETAVLELVDTAARALGVATEASLADYYRITVTAAHAAAVQLHHEGVLEPVRLPGRPGGTVRAWRHAAAVTPRTATGRALVSPFDPLVFHRPRVEALFGVRYRLGIYTPAPKRTRGYYSLLFLLGERLAAQVDLKADRANKVLLVRGAWSEDPVVVPGGPGKATGAGSRAAGVGPVVVELAAELGELAGWLDLEDVVVEENAEGDLPAELRRTWRKLPEI
ncbi:winged helix-turn-helix domain-containing protein [Cellulosimicrobium funkei]|nr:winged helix-turn-helix domain-containing protein [Cellulosimicrobium funkei]